MKPAAVILGVLVLGIVWPRKSRVEGAHDLAPTDDLERTIESNVRVLADSVRETQRLDRLFRHPR